MKQLEKIFQSLIGVFLETTSPIYKEEKENQTYFSHKQSDLWQSVARINPLSILHIILINQTGESLEYGFINEDNSSEQLLPGEMVIIHQIPEETYFFTEPENLMTSFKYDLLVTDNLVTVKVKLSTKGQTSNTVLNFAADGAIYLY